ncbi:MAG: hypothetical protein Q7T55_23990 [Solirubrobacteraceae bacterium]|nr:hypothetical protein [Solirubrobacteraceae bacterium]
MGGGCAAAAATAARAKYLTVEKDPAGDAPRPSVDIIETIARYKDDGSILFVVTLAGPVDPVGSDAGVIAALGTTCRKTVGLGIGLLSEPDVVEFSAVSVKNKKISPSRRGRGAITNNVFTFLVKHPSIAGWKPGCYAISLADPTTAEDEAPVLYDQTGEVKLAPRK